MLLRFTIHLGEQAVHSAKDNLERALFIDALLDDITALERMLKEGRIESGITRIGAEQEFCLVDEHWSPSKKADQVLESVGDEHFTNELAKYNLEINLDPLELKGASFSEMEDSLRFHLKQADKHAAKAGDKVVLTGILPTINKRSVELDYMAERPRYFALNDRLKELRGEDFELHIRGVNELHVRHDSVLFEACNTSFQTHLQIDPDDFISSYNWSQAISGPILAIAANSPLLLGRELWSETRIALFQQSIDTRHSSNALTDQRPRVGFGDDWEYGSIAEIFKKSIAGFPIILSKPIEKLSTQILDEGGAPKLPALNLHNGTVYRWNRACYGAVGGVSHVRIENRYLPSGPSIIDEMANFALWVGIMKGRPAKYNDLPSIMKFDEAKANFIKAARYGKESVMCWDGKQYGAKELMREVFLPMAHEGLKQCKIDDADRERLLGVIEKRIEGNTGAQWMTASFRALKDKHRPARCLQLLTENIYLNQQSDLPVSDWKQCDITDHHDLGRHVRDLMSTHLFTVRENDLARLALQVMEWRNIHHLPVVNQKNEMIGLLTWTHIQKSKDLCKAEPLTTVADIMVKNVHSTYPDADLKEVTEVVRNYDIGCLPVTSKGKLVGILTLNDLLNSGWKP